MKATVELIEKERVIYMRRTGAYGAENYELMELFKAFLRDKGLLEGSVLYGITHDNPQLCPPEMCRYDVAAVTYGASSYGCAQGELSGGRYAVLETEHTAQGVSAAWGSFAAEVARLGEECDFTRPIMERYAPKTLARGMCELCVPIK